MFTFLCGDVLTWLDIPETAAAEKLLKRRGQITTGNRAYNGWWLCGRVYCCCLLSCWVLVLGVLLSVGRYWVFGLVLVLFALVLDFGCWCCMAAFFTISLLFLTTDSSLQMHGIGRLTFHGAEYMGDFRHDAIDGIGCLKFVDGHVYNGMFANGDRCMLLLLAVCRLLLVDFFFVNKTGGIGEMYRGKEYYIGEWEAGQRTNLVCYCCL